MPETIQRVKIKHQDSLMALPGVVSVGIGLDAQGRPAIIVGMANADTDATVELPQTLGGYPVIKQVVGAIKAQ